jgi:hypothetical protein
MTIPGDPPMTIAERARERAQASLDLWSSFAGREPPPDEDLGQEDTEEEPREPYRGERRS